VPGGFRLGYVPGVMPGKWVRIWGQRRPDVPLTLVEMTAATALERVRDGDVDAALARPPAGAEPASLGLALIRLYDEVPVVVVPAEHLFTVADEVPLADLADETVLLPGDDVLGAVLPGAVADYRPPTTGDAVELVAAGAGVLVVPQSLARLHHRRDVVYRPLAGGPVSTVGLLWNEPTTELVDEFIGIVRGRRPGSSRGRDAEVPKRSARQKAADRRAARHARGEVPPRRSRPPRRGRR